MTAIAVTAGGVFAAGFVTNTPVNATAVAVGHERPAGPLPAATSQQDVLLWINSHREWAQIAPLLSDPGLGIAAQRHADDMARANTLSHVGSDGSLGDQRITGAGFTWTAWGENLAVGYTTSADVVAAWIGSPDHRPNLLDPQFQWMGVGMATANGTTWWSVVVAAGTPSPAAPAATPAPVAAPAPAAAAAAAPAPSVSADNSSSNSSNNTSSNSSNNSSSNSSNNTSSNSSNNSSSNSSNNSSSNSSNNSSSNDSSNSSSNDSSNSSSNDSSNSSSNDSSNSSSDDDSDSSSDDDD